MSEVAPARRISVCLLASHPVVLSEFHQRLLGSPFRLQPKKLDAPLFGDEADGAAIPRASLYVIDAEEAPAMLEALVSRIVARYPSAGILLVGDRFREEDLFRLLRMGVKGLLAHVQLAFQLERAIQAVSEGGYWVPRDLLSRFVDQVVRKPAQPALSRRLTPELSRREREVVQGLLANLSNKEIGKRLNISERTVKFHVSNLLAKFGVRRRADLIVLCYQEFPAVPGSLPTAAAAGV